MSLTLAASREARLARLPRFGNTRRQHQDSLLPRSEPSLSKVYKVRGDHALLMLA